MRGFCISRFIEELVVRSQELSRGKVSGWSVSVVAPPSIPS